MARPEPTIAIAESESNPRLDAITFAKLLGDETFARSASNASPSRTAAYWLIIAKMPVTATIHNVAYLVASDAPSNFPKVAAITTPTSTNDGAI